MEAFKTNDSAKIKELYQKWGKPSS